MTYEQWNDPTRKRYYAIPLELAYEALRYDVPIGETCRDALQRAIQEKHLRLYGTTIASKEEEAS
jgi:hypothetical protein